MNTIYLLSLLCGAATLCGIVFEVQRRHNLRHAAQSSSTPLN